MVTVHQRRWQNSEGGQQRSRWSLSKTKSLTQGEGAYFLTGRTPEQDKAHMREASCLRPVYSYGVSKTHHYIKRERCTI